jgi:hypothetical protein
MPNATATAQHHKLECGLAYMIVVVVLIAIVVGCRSRSLSLSLSVSVSGTFFLGIWMPMQMPIYQLQTSFA